MSVKECSTHAQKVVKRGISGIKTSKEMYTCISYLLRKWQEV